MSSPDFSRFLLRPRLALRPRVFVSYHHGSDRAYYEEFSTIIHDLYQAVEDNSPERRIDSNDPEYVIRRIRENFITGTSCTFVLCGPQTSGRKHVDWEIKASLDKESALIGVGLPNNPAGIQGFTPMPSRLLDNLASGYSLWMSWTEVYQGRARIKSIVDDARLRSKSLITNNRELKPTNTTVPVQRQKPRFR